MQIPEWLVQTLAGVVLVWLAAGTRWLVKLGSRVADIEKARRMLEEEQKSCREKMEQDRREHQEIMRKMDALEDTTEEIGSGVAALLKHWHLKPGLVAEDDTE